MVGKFDLPAEVLQALKTGVVPTKPVAPQTESDSTTGADAEQFRARFHAMVEAMIADWHEHHPEYGKDIPAAEREQIVHYCNREIQYLWRVHHGSQTDDDV